jgi:serine/threonine-protein kinase
VKLVVLPEDATVEIDGTAAQAKNGIVDVTGDLGSVHHVHIVKDGVETTEEVVVTVSGALPAKVELEMPKKAGGAQPSHGKPGTTHTDTPAPPPKPAGLPGITTKFE